jgi:hypothetical protein
MCTVTFSPRKHGYALAMNRDEKLTRDRGLPPSKKILHGRAVLSPSEPGGGTWISVNDHGATFALINWYAITARVKAHSVSRGTVVNAVCAVTSPQATTEILEALPLARMNSFRLIGVFPVTREIFQWRWNLEKLVRKTHRWQTQQWISSGFDEPAAQRIRSETFRRALKQKSAGTLGWLRRLHRSHVPDIGPFSTCMHRADAATVSYTEISAFSRKTAMRYFDGSPCHCTRGQLQVHQLD